MPLLILLFIVLPIVEIWVIIEVGQAIGVIPTIALLFIDGFVGAALARSQGRTAWGRFNAAISEGRMPGREVFDGAAVIVGGTLMLTPGFVTDVFALALLLPPTRAAIRGIAARFLKRAGGPAGSAAGWTYTQVRTRRESGDAERRDYDVEGSGQELRDDDRALDAGTESDRG